MSFRTLIVCLCSLALGMVFINVLQHVIGCRLVTCRLWQHRNSIKTVFNSTKHGPVPVQDKFLFVGVITASKFLTTRAAASSKTWAPRVPGKVVYFLEQGEKYKGDLDVVQLEGVNEHDYPPQKKSFAMIYHISKYYAQDYEWIVRADDDLYIQVDELVKFLKSVDNRKLLYLGQPGSGKMAERGKLGLSGPYCMGGPGVVMTKELVTALSPHLHSCLNATVTEHEDTELGRCIHNNLKIFCTSAAEMRNKFYQNYPEAWDKYSSFKKDLGESEENALTLHPIKESAYVFKIHNFLTNRTIKKLKKKEIALVTEIAIADSLSLKDKNKDQLSYRIASMGKVYPEISGLVKTASIHERVTRNRSVVQMDTRLINHYRIWDTVKHESLYGAFLESGELSTARTSKGRLLLHSHALNKIQKSDLFTAAEGTNHELQFLNLTYQCLDNERGTLEIFFVRTVLNAKKCIFAIHARRNFPYHLVEFTEPYRSKIEIKKSTIYILLLVFKRSSRYTAFLEQHRKAVQDYNGTVALRVVVYLDDEGEHKIASAVTDAILKNNTCLDITILRVNETQRRVDGMFLAMAELTNTTLLLLMNLDMEYTSEFLHRINKNTVLDHMAYFPIVFSLFSPEVICYKLDNCELAADKSTMNAVGTWRSYEFGVFSIYKSDLLRVNSFKADIEDWGLQDVELYEKIIASGLTIIRSADSGIIRR